MRELSIAYGNSRNAKKWVNKTIGYDALKERLKTPIRTTESAEEYAKMSKTQRADAKDHGGFVGGVLKGGRRKADMVTSRSMIALDGDRIDKAFLENYETNVPYTSCLYTTHSSTEEKPRVRIIFPLTRDVTPDEFAAVSRYVAQSLGMDYFDECSYQPNQLMYWPSTPMNGVFVYKEAEKEWLDPDVILAAHPEWTDITRLPTSSRESKAKQAAQKKAEDPLAKDGIVGVFCRTYTIQDTISKFLSDVYAPSAMEGRYDYIPGEGTAGVVIYDDKFAYSHHATDPAVGKLLNAFDLVRLHRFGNEDEKTSFLKMCELAESDELVKEVLNKEKLEQAQKDFEEKTSKWEEPIPFGRYEIEKFPVEALPPDIGDYVSALSESLQTPVDIAGTSSLGVMGTASQKKYVVQGKKDWVEPLCVYAESISPPSERKSAIDHGMVKPISNYENKYNILNAAAVEASRMHRRILERRQKAVEDLFAKGKADQSDVDKIALELTTYEEKKPLRLFVDDITPEKLVSVLAENDGRMAILSSEAGIFDTLAGAYSKSVNIDVLLKSYSGDQIRVDRIGRDSECIVSPALTILLMAQPAVVSKVLSNETFRGRGLTARFLYSMPESFVGKRKYNSVQVPDEVYKAYERCIFNMLEDEYPPEPEVITLSPEAEKLST